MGLFLIFLVWCSAFVWFRSLKSHLRAFRSDVFLRIFSDNILLVKSWNISLRRSDINLGVFFSHWALRMLIRLINPLPASIRVYSLSCLNGVWLRFHHFLWRLIGQIWQLLFQLLVWCLRPFQIALLLHGLGGVWRQFSLRWLGFKGLCRRLLSSGPPWLSLIVLCFGHLIQSLFSISLLFYLFVSFVLSVIVPDLDGQVLGVLLSQFINGVLH